MFVVEMVDMHKTIIFIIILITPIQFTLITHKPIITLFIITELLLQHGSNKDPKNA